MAFLIDGYNLLHVTGLVGRAGPGSFERSRMALLSLLAHVLSDEERQATTVVFDAAEAPRGLPTEYVVQEMRVYYARHHATADDLLEELIVAHHTPKRLTVVSSDHRVQRAAKRRKARAIDSDVWYVEIHERWQQRPRRKAIADVKPDTLPSPTEVQAWLKEFGTNVPEVESLPPFKRKEEARPIKKKPGKRSSAKPKPKSSPVPPASHTEEVSRPITPRKKKPQMLRKPRARSKPRDLGFGSIENPFPPGYGEDVQEE